ncbi:MAG: DNA polymerase IV [Chloroflexi bacterium]|nr:DNA polymerase IV [Chloroflexota bacterium]
MPRKIIHLDLDAFFCAVEELRQPSLSGKAFAVGGSPEGRGVVASCSYPARMFGVHSAMPTAQALRLCPELIVVSGQHARYGEVSRQVMAILRDETPLVEPISIDEAFLDMSDVPEPVESMARRMQCRIQEELRLPCSLGVASNKLVAKIANDVGKSQVRTGQPPNAITLVPPGQEAAFLAPLPTQALWGVGPKMTQALARMGIHTIGQLAAQAPEVMQERFGKHGYDLVRRAQGRDDRPVITEHRIKSISKETTFAHDVADERQLRRVLQRLAEGVGRNLRRKHKNASTVRLKLRWSDFSTISRQRPFPLPTDQDDDIIAAALQLFAEAWPSGRPVRLIGVGVSGLQEGWRQLSLWDEEDGRERKLQETLDRLRQKYGKQAVRRGVDALWD